MGTEGLKDQRLETAYSDLPFKKFGERKQGNKVIA